MTSTGVYDPGLLAIILADVTPTLQSSEWGPAESLRQTSLPMIQSLVFLGWHQLCTGEVRRGACYINVAHQLIGRWNQAQERRLGTQRMNGVDYASVALELGYRIFWLTFAIELWIALQLDSPFEYPTGINPSLNLPSPDINISSVYELDRSSGNVASLAAQEQFWRGFWPLSHICCTVGPIYALLLRVASNPQASLTEPRTYWGAETLRRLHRLVNRHRSVSRLCQTVRSIIERGARDTTNGNRRSPIRDHHAHCISAAQHPRPLPQGVVSRTWQHSRIHRYHDPEHRSRYSSVHPLTPTSGAVVSTSRLPKRYVAML